MLLQVLLVLLGLLLELSDCFGLALENFGESGSPIHHFPIIFIVALGLVIEQDQLLLTSLLLHQQTPVEIRQLNLLLHDQLHHFLKQLGHLLKSLSRRRPPPKSTQRPLPFTLLHLVHPLIDVNTDVFYLFDLALHEEGRVVFSETITLGVQRFVLGHLRNQFLFGNHTLIPGYFISTRLIEAFEGFVLVDRYHPLPIVALTNVTVLRLVVLVLEDVLRLFDIAGIIRVQIPQTRIMNVMVIVYGALLTLIRIVFLVVYRQRLHLVPWQH